MPRALYGLIGGLTTTAGLVTVFLIAIVGGLSCSGTDAGEPSDSVLCDGSTPDVLFWLAFAGLVCAPAVGTAFSLANGRRSGVAIGCGVAVATLVGLALVVRAFR